MPFRKEPLSLTANIPNNKLPVDTEELGFLDVVGDSFKVYNPLVSAFKQKDRTVDPESTFNTFERAKEDQVDLRNMDYLSYVDNEDEYQTALSEIKEVDEARQRIATAGLGGMAATVLAASASPTIFMGGGALISSLKAGRSIAKASAITGAVVGAGVLADEKIVQANQPGVTDNEVAMNTLAGFTLGALTGGIGAKIRNVKLNKLGQQLEGNFKAQQQVGKLPDLLGDYAEFDKSVGAAQTAQEALFKSEGLKALSKEQSGIVQPNKFVKPVLNGYLKLNKLWNPAVRMISAQSKNVRQFYLGVAESSFPTQAAKEGFEIAESLESSLVRRKGEYAKEVVTFNNTFKEYKKGKGNLKWQEFREEVGRAFHRDTPHSNPQIAKAVNQWNRYYESIAQELIDSKLMPKDILTAKDGARYLNRSYNVNKIKENFSTFKTTITPYLREQLTHIKNRVSKVADEVDASGKPTKEAVAAREEMQKFFGDDVFEDYLKESVDSVSNNLTKVNDIAGYKPTVAGKAGPLKKRSFNIPDRMIEDFLDNDILYLSDVYTKKVAPQIEIKNKFGDTTFDDMSKEVIKEYDELIDSAGSTKKEASLIREREEVLKDMDLTWRKIEGTYKAFNGPADSVMRRGSEALLAHNYMRSLGGVLMSSIPDVSMGILRRGASNFFGKSLKPFIKDLAETGGKMSRNEARSYGQAVEFATSSRTQSLFGTGDPMSFGTPFERFVGSASNKVSNVFGINQWNDFLQTVNTLGVRFRAVNNIVDFNKAGKLKAGEESWMNGVGIGKDKRIAMLKEIQEHGFTDTSGNTIPNIDKWSNKKLANDFKSAIGKEIDRTILTKNVADIPSFGNTTLGRMMLQWQSFNFAFNNKVIISGLARADGRTAAGFGTLVGMGMVTEALKNRASGRENPKSAQMWIDAGLDRSGFLGMLSYGNSYAENLGVSYKQLLGEEAPKTGYGGLLDTMAGPSGQTIKSFGLLIGDAAVEIFGDRLQGKNDHQFTQADLHRLRTQAWGQNVFYMKNLFDKLEKETAIKLGLPKKSRKKGNKK